LYVVKRLLNQQIIYYNLVYNAQIYHLLLHFYALEALVFLFIEFLEEGRKISF